MLRKILQLIVVGSSFALANASVSLEQTLVQHVKESIVKAERGNSKLVKGILDLEGMSNANVRHFLNNVCSLKGSNYLEIGVWKGSTFVSALYQNEVNLAEATAIDNWSEFTGPRNAFLFNTKRFLAKNKFQLCEKDSFAVDLNMFKSPVDIYFYDGHHSVESQRLALVYYYSVLADTFILIVDDYNEQMVRDGTQKGISDLKLRVVFETFLSSQAHWWNGLYVAVLAKN